MESSDIAQFIQLAVAPVFLLAGIGAFINAFASRLGRIFDRIRQLERDLLAPDVPNRETVALDLATLQQRIRLSYFGIALGTLSALLVCVLVAVAFAAYFFDLDDLNAVRDLIAGLFLAAMLALIGGLVMFLREISIAVRRLGQSRG
jgi:hypothetical protein